MDRNHSHSPFYEKLGFNLVSITLLCLALSYGSVIILPILFGILFASLLLPVTHFLEARHFSKLMAIVIPVVIVVAITITLVFLISSQVMNFLDDLPVLGERISQLSAACQKWIKESAHITIQKQNQYLNRSMENFQDQIPSMLGTTVSSLIAVGNYFFMIPLYTFLILLYRTNIKTFLIAAFRNGSEEKVRQILSESTGIAQHYIRGLLLETLLVFVLNLIGFLIIGIKYTALLALVAALLNLIPYLGMVIANVLCMITTLATSEDPKDVLLVGAALAIVQIVDNNIGMPLVVGNKVRINALVTIVGVIVGGVLCGIPGMFIAIPALAVLKIIFDKVPDLKPWGSLLGDDEKDKPNMSLVDGKENNNQSRRKVASL